MVLLLDSDGATSLLLLLFADLGDREGEDAVGHASLDALLIDIVWQDESLLELAVGELAT